MYFQDVILTLQRYWGSKGCVLLQPHDQMMGAGTFHPATVLRSLGPGAWRCAYVQPSRRPGDARYGDNPNRLGHYYQYQVVLKPSPRDVLDQYIGSLEAIGIDLRTNDLRFVEDNWQSPTLGAWGLGWEVWLNGLEVSQFTYFQQVGGVPCMPVPAEITYGLERLAMQLQGVRSVYDLAWVEGVTYGDVFHRNEVQQSKYNFEHSDADMLFEEFNRSFAECARLVEIGLVLPAYDRMIQSSHAFNLLDARGAISVAERANYIDRIRDLACRCAAGWHEQVSASDAPLERPALPEVLPAEGRPDGRRELFVEIFCEELPARYVRSTAEALRERLVALLGATTHGAIQVFASPRHVAVSIADVATARPEVRRLVLGPPAERAFSDGQPTQTAIGFAKGKGVEPSALQIVDGPKGKVIAVEVNEGGERTVDLVTAGLHDVIMGIAFAKSMEWGHGGARWGRPLHRVNAVFDGVRIVGRVADLAIGDETEGHRLATDRTFRFTGASDWCAGLRARGVEPDRIVRCEQVRALLGEARERLGCDAFDDPALFDEVVDLVEAPTLVIGHFDEALLALPPRLLVQTMKQNQRYFPVFREGTLGNEFVVISNNPWGDAARIALGNASVLLARFDDARFFLAEDRKKPLAEHGEKLAGMRWIKGLGTMAGKVERLAGAAAEIALQVGADVATAQRAGALAKADLATQMVGEFPDLQGHVGRLYAAADGEPGPVATAIEEGWQPRSAEDAVARTPAGIALALADRVDALVGCFGIGIVPKGGGDPQGLRRAALGIVRTLIDNGLHVRLDALFAAGVARFHRAVVAAPQGFEGWVKTRGLEVAARDADTLVKELTEFTLARFAASTTTTADLVDAVVSVSPPDPLILQRKVDALGALAGHADFGAILATFKRVLNITKGHAFDAPTASALTHDAERALYTVATEVEARVAEAAAALNFADALEHMLVLRRPVAELFDAVMVDAPDPAEKAVRIGLLSRVSRIFLAVADFSRISTR